MCSIWFFYIKSLVASGLVVCLRSIGERVSQKSWLVTRTTRGCRADTPHQQDVLSKTLKCKYIVYRKSTWREYDVHVMIVGLKTFRLLFLCSKIGLRLFRIISKENFRFSLLSSIYECQYFDKMKIWEV